jgi:glycosyltransferase involved in cell wall biosynthesis
MEVIVVDDGSTDDTESVLQSYENTPLVKVRRQDNAGVAAARNAGVAISGGEYLVFLDSDDELLPEDFAVKSSVIEKYPDIDLFVCDYTRSYVPGLMNRTFPSLNAEKVFQSYCASCDDDIIRLNGAFSVAYAKAHVTQALLWTGAVMLRRRLFDRVGGFRPDLKVAEDSDMWRRCLASGNSAVIRGHCSAIYFRWRGPKGKFETACIEEVRKIKKEMEGASIFSAIIYLRHTPHVRPFRKAAYRLRHRGWNQIRSLCVERPARMPHKIPCGWPAEARGRFRLACDQK